MTAHVFDFNNALTAKELEERRNRNTVDAEDIKNRLAADAQGFVEWLFSGRALCHRGEARIGDVSGAKGSSLCVKLTGKDAGLWFDHATAEGGNLVDLYMAYMGYESRRFGTALREIASEFLGDPVTVDKPSWEPSATKRIAEKKQKLGDKPYDEHAELGWPVATWRYRDLSGNVIASVERYEPDGTPESKTYRPYCFKVVDGARKWMKGAPELRPLYNQAGIAAAQTVVLVEGEKCAQALIDAGIDATTAMQGAHAPIEKTDWSLLNGKTVILWPDNDAPGRSYMKRVAERLTAIGCTSLVVDIPSTSKPEKWDCSDCLIEGDDPQKYLATAKTAQIARVKLLSIDELENLPPPTWLVQGVITEGGLSVFWGRSGTFKSFAALDIAMTIATPGAKWFGREVKHGRVVYVAAEGAYGLAVRARGWIAAKGKGMPKPDLRLVPHGIVLTSEDAEHLIRGVMDLGERPALIVIDTLARTFGSGDENKTPDMNAYVQAADHLIRETGAHVLIVHHSGKDEDRGMRGNLALHGAADTVVAVVRAGDGLKLVNEAPKGKQKDAEEFPAINLRTVSYAFESNGMDQRTLILMEDESEEQPKKTKVEPKTGKVETGILSALEAAGEPLGLTRITLMTGSSKGAVYNALKNMVSKQTIIEHDEDNKPTMWSLN